MWHRSKHSMLILLSVDTIITSKAFKMEINHILSLEMVERLIYNNEIQELFLLLSLIYIFIHMLEVCTRDCSSISDVLLDNVASLVCDLPYANAFAPSCARGNVAIVSAIFGGSNVSACGPSTCNRSISVTSFTTTFGVTCSQRQNCVINARQACRLFYCFLTALVK